MNSPQNQVFIQGHRGCRGLLPENSISAFEKALSLGVSCLELDVVISGDGEVFVSHEPFFNSEICTLPNGELFSEAEGESIQMYSMRSDSIKQYPCGNIKHERFPKQQVLEYRKPLLKEVFQHVKSYCKLNSIPLPYFNIETKNRPEWYGKIQPHPEEFAALLMAVISDEGMNERVMIQSFDLNLLRAVRELSEDSKLIILNEKPELGLNELIKELGFKPDGYSPEYILADQELVNSCEKKGIELSVWTVNTKEEMSVLFDLGIRDIITDYPDLAIELAAEKKLEVIH